MDLVESLFFDFAPYMEQEPRRILNDEGLAGANALSVLEAVGRGASRSSEIASRLGTAQTNLSRLLQQLMDASVLSRDLPFGESSRTTKRTLYQIQDPAIRFWFGVYSPHQSLWRTYPEEKKNLLIHGHAASVFEDWCRSLYPGAQRYWDKFAEIDLVCPDPENPDGLLVGRVEVETADAPGTRACSRRFERTLEPMPIERPPSGCPFQSLRCGGAGSHLNDAFTAESSFHPCENPILLNPSHHVQNPHVRRRLHLVSQALSPGTVPEQSRFALSKRPRRRKSRRSRRRRRGSTRRPSRWIRKTPTPRFSLGQLKLNSGKHRRKGPRGEIRRGDDSRVPAR